MYKVGSLPSLSGLFLCISNNINITSCFNMTPIQDELERQNNKVRHIPKKFVLYEMHVLCSSSMEAFFYIIFYLEIAKIIKQGSKRLICPEIC